MKKIYIVKYSGGEWDDYFTADIFATEKKSVATKYVTKYNKLLKKWSDYYKKFESNDLCMKWIKDEYVERHFYRWNKLKGINNCYWESINVR